MFERAEGFIEKVRIVPAKQAGGYRHELTINRIKYVRFTPHEDCEYEGGDYVRFRFRRSHYRRSKQPFCSIDESSLELCSPARSQIGGFVYVLTNKAMPHLVKIGFTTNAPNNRARALSAVTGVPSHYVVAYSQPITGDPHAVEKTVHARLGAHHYSKEFFRVSLDKAIEEVRRAYAQVYPVADFADDGTPESRRFHMLLLQRRESAAARREVALKQKAFEQTRVGRWSTSGSILITFGSINVPRAKPLNWIQKIYSSTPVDWLLMTISVSRLTSVIRVEGLTHGNRIKEAGRFSFGRISEALERAGAYLYLFAPADTLVEIRFDARDVSVPLPNESDLQDLTLRLNQVKRIAMRTGEILKLGSFLAPFPSVPGVDPTFLAASRAQVDPDFPRLERGEFFSDLEEA